MGIFGGSKSSSSSSTVNNTTTTSQSLGDLSSGNIQGSGDITVNGVYGSDLAAILAEMSGMLTTSTTANSDLAGKSIQEVASGYQAAYSKSSGYLQELKPVLMIGAGVLALILAPKILKGL